MARKHSGTKQKFFSICRHVDRPVNSRLSNNRGFTLVEIVMVTGILSILSMSLYAYSSIFSQMNYQYQTEITILNQARGALEKVVWGVSGDPSNPRKGIWEASTLSVTSATQLDYTDPDGTDHTVRLSSQRIEVQHDNGSWETLFDPNGEGAIDDATETSTQLVFSSAKDNLGNDIPKAVQIELVLGRRLVGRWYYASLSTQVFSRN